MAKAKTDEKTIDPKVMLPVLAWSPSALSSYESCPRAFQYDRMMKLCPLCFRGQLRKPKGAPDNARRVCQACGKEEPPAPPLEFGTLVHGEIENHIKGLGPFTDHMRLVKKDMALARTGYKEKKVRVELEIAFRRDWSLTAWFASDVWARFKIDYAHMLARRHVLLKDWKTGKMKDHGEYDDALECYGLGALAVGLGDTTEAQLVFTEVQDPETKRAAIVATDAGKLRLAELPKLKKKWEGRVKKLFADKRFAPRPGRCRYCPYTANKGGPCEY